MQILLSGYWLSRAVGTRYNAHDDLAQLLIKLVGMAIKVLDGGKVFKDTMLEYLYLSRRAVLLPCRYGYIDYTLPLSSYNPLDGGIKRGINSARM